MKMKTLLLILCVLFFLFVGVLLVIRIYNYQHKRCITSGTIHAVSAAFYSELIEQNPNLKHIISSADTQWQFLSDEEYDKVITEISKSHNLDPPKNWKPPGPLLDLWGNRFEIAYRRLPNGGIDTIVVSKGPDGVYGSKDDLVSRFEEPPPPKPKE